MRVLHINLILCLLCLVVLRLRTERAPHTVFHENYGVLLQHRGVLEAIQNVWHHTFAINLSTSEIPALHSPCESCANVRKRRGTRGTRGRARTIQFTETRTTSQPRVLNFTGRSTTPRPSDDRVLNSRPTEFHSILYRFCSTFCTFRRRK